MIDEIRSKVVLVCAVLIAAAGMAWGASPEDNCEATKNREAGKYALCRAKAEAKAIKKGASPDFSKCEDKLLNRWARAENRAIGNGTACVDSVGGAAIQNFVAAHADAVATALDGGLLPADVAICNGDLATCSGHLATCGDDVSSCDAALGTCDGNLVTCNSDLGTAQSDLAMCDGSLATCHSDFSQSQSALTMCTSDLSSCSGDLVGCNAALGACSADLVECEAEPKGQRVRTGQTQCWDGSAMLAPCAGTGQDGDTLTGLTVSFTDNGDGTITDNRTGLMWEKLSNDGSIHDFTVSYTWYNGFTKITALNAGGGFAGYTNWRMPNINELQSLANYDTFQPAVHAPFNTGCVGGCNVTTCSCTASSGYWSASTRRSDPTTAWPVNFFDGRVDTGNKALNFGHVRAVRGGG